MKAYPARHRALSVRTLFCYSLGLSLAGAAAGQEPVARDLDPDLADGVVELSPFEVDASQDVGYRAANTLAGSRLNTSLKDTPAAISVLTKEFLSDIGAFDINEALRYTVNTEFDADDDRDATPNGNDTVSNYQKYRIRGLPATTSRNYFPWKIPTETALLERIEDSRGPNSVLFGIASPGGLINSMTKQAQGGRAFRQFSFSLMSYDSHRTTIDINQPFMDGKLALRFNGVYNRTNTFRHYQFKKDKIAALAAKYDISKNTRIRAEFESGEIEDNRPRFQNLLNNVLLWDANGRPTFAQPAANSALGISRWGTNAATPRVTYISNDNRAIAMKGTMYTNGSGPWGNGPILDPTMTDPSINIGGPAQNRTNHYDAFSTFLEHRFSENTFLELGYNHQFEHFVRFDPRTDTPQRLKGDPNQFLADGSPNPHAGQLYLEGNWYQIDSTDLSDTGRATLSTAFDAGRWGNYRVAALGEYSKGFSGTLTLNESWVDAATGAPAFNPLPENAANRVYRQSYVTEGDWSTYWVNGARTTGLLQNVTDPVTGRTLSSVWFNAHSNSPAETYTTQKTGMAVMQARYFNNRLIVAAGLRRDDLDTYNVGTRRDPITQEWVIARNDAEATNRVSRTNNAGRTKTLGLVYHVQPWVSLFYNQSDNVSLPNSNFRLPDSGEPGNPIPLESPRGRGQDFGFALTLLEGRLYARTTYYETKSVDEATTSPSPVRAANTRIMDALLDAGLITQEVRDFRTDVGGQGVFDFKSKGVEVQITANATKNWRFQINYAYTDAVQENVFKEWRAWDAVNQAYLSQFPSNAAGDIVDSGGNVVLTSDGRTIWEDVEFYHTTLNGLDQYLLNDGQTKLGNRKHKVSVFTRYNFPSGLLKGFYIGGGYVYQSKIFTGLVSPSDRREVWAPCVGQADAMVGYTVPGLEKGRRLNFQLNILNVFDERDPIVTRYQFVNGVQLPYGMAPRSPMTWRFTTTFEF